MASGITHMLLIKNLFGKLTNTELRQNLQAAIYCLQVGSVAPDLPYASILDDDLFFSTDSPLADKFHYEKTNELILRAFRRIRQKRDVMTPDECRCLFAFFLGFTSHIVADGILHPFVRDKVGNYAQHKTAHRVLEMNLDVVFYHELTINSGEEIELNDSNLFSELDGFNPDSASVRAVLKTFRALIKFVYGEFVTTSQILGWVKGLRRMLGAAEGRLPQLYRVAASEFGIAYANYDELAPDLERIVYLGRPVDREVNFLRKERVGFIEDCVPRFYERFIPIAEKAFEYVYHGGPELGSADIDMIDLDTGRLLAAGNDLEDVPFFWS